MCYLTRKTMQFSKNHRTIVKRPTHEIKGWLTCSLHVQQIQMADGECGSRCPQQRDERCGRDTTAGQQLCQHLQSCAKPPLQHPHRLRHAAAGNDST